MAWGTPESSSLPEERGHSSVLLIADLSASVASCQDAMGFVEGRGCGSDVAGVATGSREQHGCESGQSGSEADHGRRGH